MPLFTDPLVLNDGTVNRTFSFRAQLADNNSVVGEWIEPAGTLQKDAKLVVKHDEKITSTTRRRLLQCRGNYVIADGVTLKPITVNFTITHHKEHTLAQITELVTLIRDATGEADFVSNLSHGLV